MTHWAPFHDEENRFSSPSVQFSGEPLYRLGSHSSLIPAPPPAKIKPGIRDKI